MNRRIKMGSMWVAWLLGGSENRSGRIATNSLLNAHDATWLSNLKSVPAQAYGHSAD